MRVSFSFNKQICLIRSTFANTVYNVYYRQIKLSAKLFTPNSVGEVKNILKFSQTIPMM